MDQDGPIDDVGASTSAYLRKHPWNLVIPLVVTVALEIIFYLEGVREIVLYALPGAVLYGGYQAVRAKIQHEFMQQFAAANGFSYAATGSRNGLDGSLFQMGHSQSVQDVVSGQFQNYPISLFTYIYVTGSGKSQQTHKYTIYELQFAITLPDMLLENGGHTFGESLADHFSGKELVKLEGDFNKYFSLNIPKGYEVEALEIFTPDIMAELIDKAKMFSFEIINNHLFIYDNSVVGTKQGLDNLYTLAQYLVEKLGPVLARMQPEAAAMAAEQH